MANDPFKSHRKTLTRWHSHPSLSMSTTTLNSDVDVISELDEAREEYEREYSLYLVRKLQEKMLKMDTTTEEQVKRSLVSLKMEYEQVLEENTRLYEQFHIMKGYGESIIEINDKLSKAKELLKVLKDQKFGDVLEKLSRDLDSVVNRVHLVGLKRKDFDDAFAQNLLGTDSDLYKQLKEIETYINQEKDLYPEIADELKEIETLNKENEELRTRCKELAGQVRSQTIVSNYEKYFTKATEDWRELLVGKEMCKSDNVSVLNSTIDPDKPSASSTPVI